MALKNTSIIVTTFVIGGFDTTKRPVTIGVIIMIFYILILTANLMNILFIIFDKRLHRPMFILICNLAVVDIIFTSSVCPTMIGVLLVGVNTIAYVPCLIEMFVFSAATTLEVLALAVMAFDRLLAVGFPFHYHTYLTNVRIVCIILALWVISAAHVSVMPATVLSLSHCHSRLKYGYCDYAAVLRTSCEDLNHHFNVITILSFFMLFFTFTFICLSYIGIILFVKLSSNSEKRKMGSTCLSHLIVVMCYYGPMFTRIVLTRVGLVLTLEEWHGLMIGIILGPPLVNPFVYCLRTKEIRCKIFKTAKDS